MVSQFVAISVVLNRFLLGDFVPRFFSIWSRVSKGRLRIFRFGLSKGILFVCMQEKS